MMAEVQGTQMRTVVLVGRAGNGKSSVGNSILGQDHFKIKYNYQFGGQLENQVAANAEVKVVDCTGIGDTGSDMVGDIHSVIQSAREAVHFCDPGFHALIFVMKYGFRFTKQEKDAVQMVKSIFGENVFRDWGILVFSCGDNFELDTEGDGMTFEDWCRKQTGDIKTLFEEVDYRCAVFDNKTLIHKKVQREKQRKSFEKILDDKGGCYSLSDFENAKGGREILIAGEEFKKLKKETKERNSLKTPVHGQVTMLQRDLNLVKPKTRELTVTEIEDLQKLKLDMSRDPIHTSITIVFHLLKSFFQ